MSEKITPFRRGAKWGDPDTLATLNRLIAAANTTGELTGDGTITVSRSPSGARSVGISVAKLIPQIPKPLPIRWGKATATWTTGNTVTLDPCDVAGNDRPHESNVTAYVVSPTADSPDPSIDPEITIGDVLAYLPFWSADVPPLPCGTLLNTKWALDTVGVLAGTGGEMLLADDWFEMTQNIGWTTWDARDWGLRELLVWGVGANAVVDGTWSMAGIRVYPLTGPFIAAPTYPVLVHTSRQGITQVSVLGYTCPIHETVLEVAYDETDSYKLKYRVTAHPGGGVKCYCRPVVIGTRLLSSGPTISV